MRIKYDLQSVAIIAVNYKHAVDKKVRVVSSWDFDGNHCLPSPTTLSVFRYKTRPPLHLRSRISPVKQGTSFWQATRLTLAQILHTRNPILLYMENVSFRSHLPLPKYIFKGIAIASKNSNTASNSISYICWLKRCGWGVDEGDLPASSWLWSFLVEPFKSHPWVAQEKKRFR